MHQGPCWQKRDPKYPKTVAEISANENSRSPNSNKDCLKITKLSPAKEIQLSAIQWIRAKRPPAQNWDWYPMLVAYWMSGKDTDFTGQPIPSYSTVYNWLQHNQDVSDSVQEMPAVPVAAIAADTGGSPSLGKTVSDSGILSGVLACALKHILKHLCKNDQYSSIIRLSSMSSKHLAVNWH
jgi:hypothetical protein